MQKLSKKQINFVIDQIKYLKENLSHKTNRGIDITYYMVCFTEVISCHLLDGILDYEIIEWLDDRRFKIRDHIFYYK